MRETTQRMITLNYPLKWQIIIPLLILLLNGVQPLEAAKSYLPAGTNSGGDTVLVTVGDLASAIPINDNIFGGFVTARLRGAYLWDSDLGLNDKLNEYGIRSVRLFGCKSEIYHWRDMVGPVNERKMWKHVSVCFGNDVRNLNNPGIDDVSWGPDEFLNFFTSRGIEVIGTVNFGTGSAQEAANFVEYVNGISPSADGNMINGWTPESFAGDEKAPAGYFACLRHFFGRRQPYGLRYWEVGNELYAGGGSGASWTRNKESTGEQLYFTGGTNFVVPGFTTRDPDRYDWSSERRQTTGSSDERFYVMFPPIAALSASPVQMEFIEVSSVCEIIQGEEHCSWQPQGAIMGWQEGSLAAAGPEDQVFEVNRPEGYIKFGDGVNGKIPPYDNQSDRGYEVLLSYPSGPHDGFVDFANAMKAVDPTIKIGAAFGWHSDEDKPIPPPLLPDEILSTIGFFVWHPYVPALGPSHPDLNVAPDLEEFRATVMAWSHSQSVEGLPEAFHSQLGDEVEFAWTEWNLTHSYAGTPPNSIYVTSLDVGLFVADMLRQMIVSRVSIANYFVLNGWPGPVRAQGGGLFTMNSTTWPPQSLVQTTAQPGALAFKMFNDYFGPIALPTTVTNSPEFTACWPNCPEAEASYPVIEALASNHPDGRLAILIINKDDSLDVEVAIKVASNTPRDGSVGWAILNSADPSVHPGEVTNTLEDPDAVLITAREMPFAEPLQLTIPAHTVNMVVLPAGTPTGVSEPPDGLPEKFELLQNYPNPFNPETTLRYSVANQSHVQIKLFNTLGQHIRTLVEEEKAVGDYSVLWDGRDKYGNNVASGVYIYEMQAAGQLLQKKLILLR